MYFLSSKLSYLMCCAPISVVSFPKPQNKSLFLLKETPQSPDALSNNIRNICDLQYKVPGDNCCCGFFTR